jgi:hypothetical protein
MADTPRAGRGDVASGAGRLYVCILKASGLLAKHGSCYVTVKGLGDASGVGAERKRTGVVSVSHSVSGSALLAAFHLSVCCQDWEQTFCLDVSDEVEFKVWKIGSGLLSTKKFLGTMAP